MTTEQAIGTLDNAVSQMKLSREEHNHLMAALKVLVEATADKEGESDGEHDHSSVGT